MTETFSKLKTLFANVAGRLHHLMFAGHDPADGATNPTSCHSLLLRTIGDLVNACDGAVRAAKGASSQFIQWRWRDETTARTSMFTAAGGRVTGVHAIQRPEAE
ncbi:hypothetical protein EJB05_42907 [Eragrostis curvula]|uniref:Uncharacterized protein n=1 Tax=Eragrostis curvula TaxID=38414 RepID=A0A5J9TDK1_9POAL|nr:hypothetical protein EJB05_42907 [Eragrostis curvula]